MPRSGASPSPPRPSPSPSLSRTPAYPETPGARGLTRRRRPRARARGRPPIPVGSLRPVAKPARPPVRKGVAGGSGCGGEDGSRPGGGRGRRGVRAAAQRPGAGRRPGPLCEGRQWLMGSEHRGRVSGERRPAPRSASSRRTGGQLGSRARAFSAWGWPGREARAARLELQALAGCVGPAATRASSTWGAWGGGGGGGPGEPGRARGGSAGSLRREERFWDRDEGPEKDGSGVGSCAPGWEADWSEAAKYR